MTGSDRAFDRLSELFELARRRPAEERSAFLDEACSGDEDLRSELESLLGHHEDASTFLESLDVGETHRESFSDRGASGHDGADCIGPYRILETLGEGGMGTVYLAEQEEPLRRKVALKVIKLGMDTKEVVRRFESERQTLALMEHSSIAKVYDAGSTEEGRPYFVMEYVDGKPINEFCDEIRSTNRERLKLFIQVCEGIQHAHQKGVIHRDIKPSNILVTVEDGAPRPKVIDFGVAKATATGITADTFVTEAGQAVGTPAYMSPEQSDLSNEDIDTRSDIYSLGVLLYELLVGALPIDFSELHRAGYEAVRRAIQESATPRPSTRLKALGDTATRLARARSTEVVHLVRELQGDLDWIALRALEKERSRRYASVAELFADIKRYLKHEPVLASPPSAAYRFKKFARRNRVALSLTAAGLLIATLVSVSTWLSVSVERSARELRERDYGAAVLSAVGEMQLADLSAREARERFGVLHPLRMNAQELLEGTGLSSAAAAIRALSTAVESVPYRADAYWYRARAYQLLESHEEARRDLTRALELDPQLLPALVALADSLGKAGDDVDAARLRRRVEDVAADGWARHWLDARSALRNQEWALAAQEYARAIELVSDREPYVGWELQTRLEQAIALLESGEPALALSEIKVVQFAWPESLEAGILEGRAHLELGSKGVERASGVFQRVFGRAKHKTAIALRIAAVYADDGEEALRWIEKTEDEEIRLTFRAVGLMLLGRGREAFDVAKQAVALPPRAVSSYAWLGRVLINLGQRPTLELALEVLGRATELDPGVGHHHVWIARAHGLLGSEKKARESLQNALRLGPTAPHTFYPIVAGVYELLGDHDHAREYYDLAVELESRNPISHNERGRFLAQKLQLLEEALESFEAAIAIDESFAWPHTSKAEALMALSKSEANPQLLERAIESFRRGTRGVPRSPRAFVGLARASQASGDTVGAFKAYADAVAEFPSFGFLHGQLRSILDARPPGIAGPAAALERRLQDLGETKRSSAEVEKTLAALAAFLRP